MDFARAERPFRATMANFVQQSGISRDDGPISRSTIEISRGDALILRNNSKIPRGSNNL
ncbi:hypothetical protein [Lentibacillus sp. CBA3610]|uniref:hypothetical protein n=1 Tax=Lentibacillus sp. CBA3610 TaxID=2518176 RepID=UPI0015961AB3|nr:hypothetical protein [Lentibacillus sp. CBA3610]